MGLCGANEKPGFTAPVESLREELRRLPIGWKAPLDNAEREGWISKLVGWIITALAVSLGAPFWFDMLNKLNSLRSTGIKPKAANG